MNPTKAFMILTLCGVFIAYLILYEPQGAMVEIAEESSKPISPSTPPRQDQDRNTLVPAYEIVSSEDTRHACKSYRVRVPREMTRDELTAISRQMVQDAQESQRVNAIRIFFYLPDSDTEGVFTAGRAVWAPGGDWRKAPTNLTSQLIVDVKPPVPKEIIVDLPIERKKQIYFWLVQYDNAVMDVSQACTAAAKEFHISVEQAKKIGLEGGYKGWPMPRPEQEW